MRGRTMTQFWILDCQFSIERSESRKIFCLILCAVLFALCVPAAAQQSAKVAKIGWLGARSASAPARELFERELRALGYVEGKNVAFEHRYAEGKLDRLRPLADELVHLRVGVLIAAATPAALAAKNATNTTPIVFYTGSDPVALGLVDSLARPGGEHHRVHQRWDGIVWQASGVTQGNHSQSLPRCGAMESTGSSFCTTMERKPITSERTGSATSFFGGEPHR